MDAVKTTQQYASFEDMVRASEHPVLVDFHAQWCGPCKLMGNTLQVGVLGFPRSSLTIL
jgi:protein disulfide-isomerase